MSGCAMVWSAVVQLCGFDFVAKEVAAMAVEFAQAVGNTELSPTPAEEVYSRKVFIGGLPLDSTAQLLLSTFSKFGPLTIEWPERKSKNFPGFAFLHFQAERSVHLLIDECYNYRKDLFFPLSTSTAKNKPAHIRPWKLEDSKYILNPNAPIEPRRTIFIGGIPRAVTASEIATRLSHLYGPVCFLEILLHPATLYPMGAARGTFIQESAFIAAMKSKFLELPEGGIMKRVRMKPYLPSEQVCDECGGAKNVDVKAVYFCENASCLQYYCETCWDRFHYGKFADGTGIVHRPYARINGEVKLLTHPSHHSCDHSKVQIAQ
uniref:Cytoplasmic polyadenylation element-binding protein 1 n=1 Tax=Ascaris suum TaxID=6253 RepID=F1L267_ASCSU